MLQARVFMREHGLSQVQLVSVFGRGMRVQCVDGRGRPRTLKVRG